MRSKFVHGDKKQIQKPCLSPLWMPFLLYCIQGLRDYFWDIRLRQYGSWITMFLLCVISLSCRSPEPICMSTRVYIFTCSMRSSFVIPFRLCSWRNAARSCSTYSVVKGSKVRFGACEWVKVLKRTLIMNQLKRSSPHDLQPRKAPNTQDHSMPFL